MPTTLSAFLLAGVPVVGSRWREVEPRSLVRVEGAVVEADGLWVRLEGGERHSTPFFLRTFEPVADVGGDWLDEAIVRAQVRAVVMSSPTEDYPLTLATVWRPEAETLRAAQVIVSLGLFCGDCVDLPEDLRAQTEVVRLAAPQRCRCGGFTRWYHVADERRTMGYVKRWG